MAFVDPLLCVFSVSFHTSIAVWLHTSKDECSTCCLYVLAHMLQYLTDSLGFLGTRRPLLITIVVEMSTSPLVSNFT